MERSIEWYKDALKSAIEMEDFDEAKQLKAKIQELESKDLKAVSLEDSKEFTVTIKSVYGKEMIYPVCNVAKLLAMLVDKKTFTERDLDIIFKLGYVMKQV